MNGEQTAGWASLFPPFHTAKPHVIRTALQDFVREENLKQIRAWDESIPFLQREAGLVLDAHPPASEFSAILEYQLPLDARRPDVVVLANGIVVVIEIKAKASISQADLDQVAAYARDLRAYHRDCADRPVRAVLVPTRFVDIPRVIQGVHVVRPTDINALLRELSNEGGVSALTRESFLAASACRPLPTIVEAARELLLSGEVREIWRARAATDPAVNKIADVAHEAARTKTRHLVLVTGVPGAGKTLVGMRAVHAHFLDDLAVARTEGKPTVPALYLSGNGPLVQVLQYELKKSGGGGKTFVRHIKSYLDRYVPRPDLVPEEHLLVFDEAQRAFNADKVADTHKQWPLDLVRSEPELFIRVCERMPEWSVLIGLIGGGQEIHVGEEEGLGQWRTSLEGSASPESWTVHAPAEVEEVFGDSGLTSRSCPELNLTTELRFHQAKDLHKLVERLLDSARDGSNRVGESVERYKEADLPGQLFDNGLRLLATRDLEAAKAYLHDRYADDPEARFGLLASSRDRDLGAFGIDNTYQTSRVFRVGAWYAEDESHPHSCRRFESVATEFSSQGLELSMALVCWGTDLVRQHGTWNIDNARGYGRRGRTRAKDPFQMRINAYRVLLTRGRDGTVVFVPELPMLDETWRYLLSLGFRELRAGDVED